MFAPLRHNADAGSVDENLVRLAAIDHLGVAGDKGHARRIGRVAHRLHDPLEIIHRQAFLEDKSDREMERTRAAHG